MTKRARSPSSGPVVNGHKKINGEGKLNGELKTNGTSSVNGTSLSPKKIYGYTPEGKKKRILLNAFDMNGIGHIRYESLN